MFRIAKTAGFAVSAKRTERAAHKRCSLRMEKQKSNTRGGRAIPLYRRAIASVFRRAGQASPTRSNLLATTPPLTNHNVLCTVCTDYLHAANQELSCQAREAHPACTNAMPRCNCERPLHLELQPDCADRRRLVPVNAPATYVSLSDSRECPVSPVHRSAWYPESL